MHLGWSSRVYPLYARDLSRLADYGGPKIPAGDLPPDDVLIYISKGSADTLLRGRGKVEEAGEGIVNARIVFRPSVSRWNLFATLVRFFRNAYRYKSSQIYHIRTKDIRRMGLERAIRTLDNPHRRGNVDRMAKMARLEKSLREKGYDDSRPIAIMLCRTGGAEDSLRQGHHRVSACISCGIETMAVRFSAAGALPKCLRGIVRTRSMRKDVAVSALSNAFSVRLSCAIRVPGPGMNLIAVPENGGRFVVKLVKNIEDARKMADLVGSRSGRRKPESLLRKGPVRAGRYFAVACEYERGKSLPIEMELKKLKRNFGEEALRLAIEKNWGVPVASVKALPGHAHSLNYKVESCNGMPFAAKLVPSGRSQSLVRLAKHAAMAKNADTTTLLFGGRTFTFGNWTVVAMRWIEGERRAPEELSKDEIRRLVKAHSHFLSVLSDDGGILPVRDLAAMKAEVMAKAGEMPQNAFVDELGKIGTVRLDPKRLSIIHGDMHFENFRFREDGGIGFLDIEELRWGTPAEDIVRYIVSRAERLGPLAISRRKRLLRAFAEFVRTSSCTRDEWIFAIDGYLLKKLVKKFHRAGISFAGMVNLEFRFAFYRRLREIVRNLKPREPSSMPVVKVVGGAVRRFIGHGGVEWKGRMFFTADPSCEDYDWLCVYDELPAKAGGRISLGCPCENTMLLTQEPESIKTYSDAYLGQFAVILTNRSDLNGRHPCVVKGSGYMVWYTGRSFAEELAAPAAEKTRVLSAVYSSKHMEHTLHGRRSRVLDALVKAVPGFDRFGKGFRKIERKSDALDPYEYHVAYENHAADGFWTEKLSDAVMCRCLAFYTGAPDIAKYLPKEAFIAISPDATPEEYANAVREAIAAGECGKRQHAIEEARTLLAEKFNLFAQIEDAIAKAGDRRGVKPRKYIYSRRALRRNPFVAVSDMTVRIARFFKRSRFK